MPLFGPRLSTFRWVKQLVTETTSNHEEILERFEESDDRTSQEIDPNAQPVNIFCVDGGGLRGGKITR